MAKTFLRYLISTETEEKEEDFYLSKNYKDLPIFKAVYPNSDIVLRHVAPYDPELHTLINNFFPSRLTEQSRGSSVNGRPRTLSLQPDLADGLWNEENDNTVGYAMSISLYEDEPPEKGGKRAGDPNADCCAVITTKNTAIMVCADGCGWGESARRAARCAVLTMCKSLTRSVYYEVYNTEDAFTALNSGLNTVQRNLISSREPGLTTLCATVILPRKPQENANTDKPWMVCNLRVGDTSTYLYDTCKQQLQLISHRFSDKSRDLKDCGGCLGPVVGDDPDLENLTYSLTLATSDSTVFLATDGVGDNFNPYVVSPSSAGAYVSSNVSSALIHKVYCNCECDWQYQSLGSNGSCDIEQEPRKIRITDEDLTLHSKYCTCSRVCPEAELCPTLVDILSLRTFQQTINDDYMDGDMRCLASTICRKLVRATETKRLALSRFKFRISSLPEDEVYEVNRIHRNYVKTLPGKLDHASIVAANLKQLQHNNLNSVTMATSTTNYSTKTIRIRKHSPAYTSLTPSPSTSNNNNSSGLANKLSRQISTS